MKKQFKLGVIGCGIMAQSIIRGAVLSDFLHEKKIAVTDFSGKYPENILSLGIKIEESAKYIAENSEFLLLAVKNSEFDELKNQLTGVKPEKIISIMPNVSKNEIKNIFGLNMVRVCKCLPNYPCSIGSGVLGVDMSDFNKITDDTEFISNIFNCVGTVLSIDESKMDAVAGISVNGPAYVFMFIDSLIDSGIKYGLSRSEAKILAVQTVLGAAEMVERDELSVGELLKQVCGLNNTALEAVKIYSEKDFAGTVKAAVDSCVRRHSELTDK